MGKPRTPEPVQLICGLIGGDVGLLRRARRLLVRRFGPTDLESDFWSFDQTEYYREEMGPDLKRWFISFERSISPESILEIKLETNAIEAELADDCAALGIVRPVNLDPGYVDLGKLVLATTKDRSHRVYLGRGIFAECTLHFVHDRWQTWPWTFPDYHQPQYHEFFVRVRERLLARRRQSQRQPTGAGE
ncbi:MAG: DUF4416 family protein [Phycisphaerae bacterium]|jgi:hypothetical protein